MKDKKFKIIIDIKIEEEDNENVNNDKPVPKIFTKFVREWKREKTYMLETLIAAIETYLNVCLMCNGVIYVNQVYDALKLSRLTLGEKYGWVYDLDNPKQIKLHLIEYNNKLYIDIDDENINEMM